MKKAMNQSTLTFILNGVSIFALLFMIVSLILYSGVSSRLNSANEERFALTYNANRFMNGSAYLTNEVRAFAATGDKEHYDNYWNEVNNLKNRDIGVATMQEIGITTEEQSMIDKMSSLSNALVPLEDEAMSNVQAGHMEDAIEYVYGAEYSTSIAKINSLKEQFLETLEKRSKPHTGVHDMRACDDWRHADFEHVCDQKTHSPPCHCRERSNGRNIKRKPFRRFSIGI